MEESMLEKALRHAREARADYLSHETSENGTHFRPYYSTDGGDTYKPALRLFCNKCWDPDFGWTAMSRAGEEGLWIANSVLLRATVARVRTIVKEGLTDSISHDKDKRFHDAVLRPTSTPAKIYRWKEGTKDINTSHIADALKKDLHRGQDSQQSDGIAPRRTLVFDGDRTMSVVLMSDDQSKRLQQSSQSSKNSSPKLISPLSCSMWHVVNADALHPGRSGGTYQRYVFPQDECSNVSEERSPTSSTTLPLLEHVVRALTCLPESADLSAVYTIAPTLFKGDGNVCTVEEWLRRAYGTLTADFTSHEGPEFVSMALSTRTSDDPNTVLDDFAKSSIQLRFQRQIAADSQTDDNRLVNTSDGGDEVDI